MAGRETMVGLIARLRKLIGDLDETPVLDDEELQSFLDRRRVEWRYARLQPLESIAPGGAVTYVEHVAARGNWEAGEKLFDSSYNELTVAADGADRVNGRWMLAASCYSVLIKGFTYDLYAAAADALDEWASRLKEEVSFMDSGRQFTDSQKFQQVTTLASRYRSSMIVETGGYCSTDWSAHV